MSREKISVYFWQKRSFVVVKSIYIARSLPVAHSFWATAEQIRLNALLCAATKLPILCLFCRIRLTVDCAGSCMSLTVTSPKRQALSEWCSPFLPPAESIRGQWRVSGRVFKSNVLFLSRKHLKIVVMQKRLRSGRSARNALVRYYFTITLCLNS